MFFSGLNRIACNIMWPRLTSTVAFSTQCKLYSPWLLTKVDKEFVGRAPYNIRGFHTTDTDTKRYKNEYPRKKKIIKLKWNDLAQPELKPIGPEDYHRWRYFLNQPAIQKQEISQVEKCEQISEDIFDRVNHQIVEQTHGRLFAVIHIGGKQFKVTDEDIIVVRDKFPPLIGDRIVIEKVLLVGSSDFTLIGKPLLSKDMVRIEATVIEKTLSHIFPYFTFIKRAHHRRLNLFRTEFTMLRINYIQIRQKVNELRDVEGTEGRILV